MYAIKLVGQKKYVARAGHKTAYVDSCRGPAAAIFATKEASESNSCKENETVVKVHAPEVSNDRRKP